MADDESESSKSITDVSREPTQLDPADALMGAQIGNRYSVLAKVAKGGTAVVYRALDTVLNREVAVKILHEHLENKTDVSERFRKEAQLIAQLRHPNILTVYDYLEYRQRAVLVVEFMPGITLSALVNETAKIQEDIVLMITLEILHGLKAAHQRGITHRDIKPANVLIHADLGVKISDFGLAKILDSDDGLTKAGVFVGTPSFSSPEQIEGRPVDHRSDLFSLGLTTYMLATRSHAFKKKGDSTTTVWFKTVRGSFESARQKNPELSEEFENIVNKALEVQVEKRYQSADAMIKDVEKILRKRNLLSYQSILKSFLKNPQTSTGLPSRGKIHFAKRLKLAVGIFGIVALAAAAIFYVLEHTEDVPVFEPSPEASIATPEPTLVSQPIEEAPTPIPTSLPTATKAPPARAIIPPVKPKPTPAPVLEKAAIGIPLAAKSLIVSNPGEATPPFLVSWEGSSDFILATDSNFSNILERGQSKLRGWALKNLYVGSFFWKGGSQSGEIRVEGFESYRNRVKATRRPLMVSTQFGDVDLELNPWAQDLKLSWQSGPDAHSYRIELAGDSAFAEMIFSSVSVAKSATIERVWDKSRSLYWRVSYLDEARNVFLIDPVRKINLTLKGGPSYLDLLSPQAGEWVREGALEVKALGPTKVGWSCAAVEEGKSTSQWEALKVQNAFFVGRLQILPSSKWILCEAKGDSQTVYFSIPLRSK